jgi:hypothetical protein
MLLQLESWWEGQCIQGPRTDRRRHTGSLRVWGGAKELGKLNP